MASLVTLNAAPYNPYGETLGRFAMQGLQMGIQQMQFRENMAMRAAENSSRLFSEATQNAFKGVEFQMRRKEFDHRVENDLFNNMLKKESLGLEGKRLDLAKDQFSYQKEHDKAVDDPYKQALTDRLVDENSFLDETRPIRLENAKLESQTKQDELIMNQMRNNLFIEKPELLSRDVEASVRAKEANVELLESRSKYYTGKNSDISMMTPAQAERSLRGIDISLATIRKDLSKIQPDKPIPDDPRLSDIVKRKYESENAKNKEAREKLIQDELDIRERKRFLEQRLYDIGGGNAPASGQSSVSLPGQEALNLTPLERVLRGIDAGSKPSEAKPHTTDSSWLKYTEE